MFIGIDMRPWAENRPEKSDFFSIDFLHALFRNHPSDVFILWTTGEHQLPENLLFDEYDNTRVLHTKISSKNLSWFIDWFSAIDIDDLIETECMKQGIMPWNERLSILFVSSSLSVLTEENCFVVAILPTFPQAYVDTKLLSRAKMVVVPSVFSFHECQYLSNIATEKMFVSSVGIAKDIIPFSQKPEHSLWAHLPEKFFFTKVQDQTSALTIVKAFELFTTRFMGTDFQLIIEESIAGSLHFLYDKKSNIHILSPLSTENHHAVLAQCTVYIDASVHDTVGYHLLECMRREIPCLVSSFGALPEVAFEDALFFDPTKATDIYRQMKKIIEIPELLLECKKKGKERSRDAKFFIDDIAIAVLAEAKKRRAS